MSWYFPRGGTGDCESAYVSRASNVPLGRILAPRRLALLLGGTAFWFASQRAGQETQGLAQQPAAAAHIDESTASFASLLMEIQGLNEDGFFRTEEAESLWL